LENLSTNNRQKKNQNMLQSLYSWFSWSTPTEPLANTIPYHICGVYPSKQRQANNKTVGGTRSATITTINYQLKEKKEENTVSALKRQIVEDLNLPRESEIKIFYGGKELGKDCDLLSMYVLEQERDVLFEPHIVVAVKEGIAKQSTTPTTNTNDKPEEKKVENSTVSTKTDDDQTIGSSTTLTVEKTLSATEQEFEYYNKFEVKVISSCDPIILEQCECYSLPGCGHGISGDSLGTYAWLSANDRKECVIRCPNIKIEDGNQDTPVCGNAVPFTMVKKILSHHLKKKGTKKKNSRRTNR